MRLRGVFPKLERRHAWHADPRSLPTMRVRPVLLPLLTVLAVGCSDLPTELAEPASLHATELGLRANVRPYARAALFRDAVERVARQDGVAALWRQTAELRAHAAAARAADARGAADAQIEAEQAHRRAQVRFTASALGDARIDDVAREVRLALTDARAAVAASQAAGTAVARAASFLDEAAERLDRAAATPVAILDAAMDAADLLDRTDQLLLSVSRLPSIDDLFARAISDIRRDAGPVAARALLGEYQTVVREAEQALRSDGRVRTHERLSAARAKQVSVVAGRIGEDGVRRYLARVRAAENALRVSPAERRREIARDLLGQSVSDLRAGRIERALDRAAMAGEIVNALAAEGR